MIDQHHDLHLDIEAVQQISIVPMMLEVVCEITGLGFAAIARVTEDRWIACTVRDEVNFGLVAGGELEIKTTICNEIRDSREPVVIDYVDEDEFYRHHHTPKHYGLQSYISFPIILKNGQFFGTLCAIRTEPAQLNNPKVTGTFELFAELLSFHLQSLDLAHKSYSALKETSRQLDYTTSENVLYQQISDHNLQEQIRKINIYSDLLISEANENNTKKIKETALKINRVSQELNNVMKHIRKFTALSGPDPTFEKTDLNVILQVIQSAVEPKLKEHNIKLAISNLPVISAVPDQMTRLFYQLIDHGIMFSKKDAPTSVHISSKLLGTEEKKQFQLSNNSSEVYEITILQNGIELEEFNQEIIFDILVHSNKKDVALKYGAGLADCRKILHNHGGIINVAVTGSDSLSFRIVLPEKFL